jgi:type I restriction enzyme S subunit
VAQSPPASGRAFFIRFSELDRWIPPRRSFDARSLPKSWQSVRIGDVVSQVTTREAVLPDNEYKMAGVKWYAEGIFHRETVLGSEMSAKHVTLLVPGALIYNRLFAWKESFAVVGREHAGLNVSGEFPQFVPDAARVLSEFMYLYCTLPKTIEVVNAASVGSAAVSRNRFKEEEFLNLDMPLPPLTEQRAIVERWRLAQAQIAAAGERVKKVGKRVDADFLGALGFRSAERKSPPKAFAARWAEFGRWSVSFNQHALTGMKLEAGKYPLATLDSLLALVQYGTSEKANERGRGVPVLRIGNIKDRVVNMTDLKHIELPAKSLESLLLKDGDMLIIRTSGSRDLVGTCAVFHSNDQAVFASYLIRLRFDTSRANPDYVCWFLNSVFGRQQVDSISRQIMQNNINAQEIRTLRVPLPPLEVQRKLVERVMAARAEMARERAAAAQLCQTIANEVEALILGKGFKGNSDG